MLDHQHVFVAALALLATTTAAPAPDPRDVDVPPPHAMPHPELAAPHRRDEPHPVPHPELAEPHKRSLEHNDAHPHPYPHKLIDTPDLDERNSPHPHAPPNPHLAHAHSARDAPHPLASNPEHAAPHKRTTPTHMPMHRATTKLTRRGMQYSPQDLQGGGKYDELGNWCHDQAYMVALQIGSPPQSVPVQIDTASWAMTVWGSESQCQDDNCRQATQRFDESQSTSYHTDNEAFGNNYVVSGGKGIIANETVSLAGYTADNVQFGLEQSGNGADLMGMAIGGYGKFPYSMPVWRRMVDQWPQPQFSMYLAKDPGRATKDDPSYGGTLTLGGTDTSLYTGDFTWINSVSEVQWLVPVQSFSVGGQSVITTQNPSGNLDTGTGGIMGPLEEIRAMYARIPGAKLSTTRSTENVLEYYEYPCGTSLNIQIAIGGITITLPPEDEWFARSIVDGKAVCTGSIYGFNNTNYGTTYILGDSFLKQKYTTFVLSDPPKIGFADLASNVPNPNTGATQQGSDQANPAAPGPDGAESATAADAASGDGDPAASAVSGTVSGSAAATPTKAGGLKGLFGFGSSDDDKPAVKEPIPLASTNAGKGFLDNVFNSIGNFVSGAVDTAGKAVTKAGEKVTGALDKITDKVTGKVTGGTSKEGTSASETSVKRSARGIMFARDV